MTILTKQMCFSGKTMTFLVTPKTYNGINKKLTDWGIRWRAGELPFAYIPQYKKRGEDYLVNIYNGTMSCGAHEEWKNCNCNFPIGDGFESEE